MGAVAVNVVALDLALATTGVAWPDGNAATVVTNLDASLPKRLRELTHRITVPIAALGAAPVVVIEDLPMARLAGPGIGILGMVHGAIRCALDELVDADQVAAVMFVQPSQLKRYATGKGNASKSSVLVEAVKRLGYDGYDDNEADALWLRAMAMDHYDAPVVTMPAAHRVALDKVEWPVLPVPDPGLCDGAIGSPAPRENGVNGTPPMETSTEGTLGPAPTETVTS